MVVEFRCSELVRMPRSTMHVVSGSQGVRHPGVKITRVHFNIEYMRAYLELEAPVVRQTLTFQPTEARVCACRRCGRWTHSGRADFWDWQKSKKGLYYTRRCYFSRMACVQVTL